MNGMEIAVIGMSCRFPGAAGIQAFWKNIASGTETISFFEEDLENSMPGSSQQGQSARHVRAGGVLDHIERFDAEFFNYKGAEARAMDPQIRLLHECCWEALEDAGYDPFRYPQRIGIFTGAASNLYWQLLSLSEEASSDAELLDRTSLYDRSFASSRIAYSLNLRGPSMSLDTACSTSLTGIHAACQALLGGECEMALAGGATITLPQTTGHYYQEGFIVSPDGHCRTFDDQSQGTVWSNGAGIVLLKPLPEAIEEQDHIYAVIKATAINNDGRRKVGYTAPSVEGQAELISVAHRMAGVEPHSIGLMEAHGTATRLGDPVEIEALRLAFRSKQAGYCALGSVKSLIGHADRAAGIAAFIKTVLSLYHRKLPPTAHFRRPNAEIAFDRSPFYINDRLRPWSAPAIRRAAVNSLGVGGSNAYAILEEYVQEPSMNDSAIARDGQESDTLIMLSANSADALQDVVQQLADHLNKDKSCLPERIGYTLYAGRRQLPYRKAFVCRGRQEAIRMLSPAEAGITPAPVDAAPETAPELTIFLSDGAELAKLDRSTLYDNEPVFRTEFMRCLEAVRQITGSLIPPTANTSLSHSDVAMLGFAVQAAALKLMLSWGLQPAAWSGSSSGLFAASYLSGDVSLEASLTQLEEWLGQHGSLTRLDKPSQAGPKKGVKLCLALAPQAGESSCADGRTVYLQMAERDTPDLRRQLLRCVGELWTCGIPLDGRALFPEQRKTSLPTYPFERSLYWLEGNPFERWQAASHASQAPLAEEERKTPDHWLYYPTWSVCSRQPAAAIDPEISVLLLFCRGNRAEEGLLGRLKQEGYRVIQIRLGDGTAMQHTSEDTYILRPLDTGQIHQLFSAIQARGLLPTDVMYLWSAADESETTERLSHASIIVQWVQALTTADAGSSCRLRVVTREMMEVVGDDQRQPWQGELSGLLTVVQQEHPNMSCQLIDASALAIEGLADDSEEGRRLYQELTITAEDMIPLVAYRNRKRWSLSYTRLEPAAPAGQPKPEAFRKQGVYWIIGGLGQIGLGIADYLARSYQARLILSSRHALPAREQWEEWLATHPTEDTTARRIAAIQEMERHGAQVLICPVDAANLEAMAEVEQQGAEALGPLNGVFLAAVHPEITRLLAETDSDFMEQHWRAKAGALTVLETLFSGRQLDHIILMSSLSSILGGLGMGAYASANAWMDSCVASLNDSGHPHWRCINWDGWNTAEVHEADKASGQGEPEIRMEEGIAALELALATGESRLIIATTDLNKRKKRGDMPRLSARPQTTEGAGGKADIAVNIKPRPVLSTPFEPVAGETEQRIAALLERLLEMHGIGMEDHFFELGGDSLQAIQMIASLQKQLGLQIGLSDFIQAPTIRALACRLNNQMTESKGSDTTRTDRPELVITPLPEQTYPLSPAQRRMYVLHQLYPDSLQYNLPFAFRLEGPIDPDKVEHAFGMLIKRHESLRTAIVGQDDHPVQLIREHVDFGMERQLLEHGSGDSDHEIARALERFIRPFELTTAPLLRVLLVTTAPDHHVLALDMHHIISDGVTLKIVLSEFMMLYQGTDLPNVERQYKDYSQGLHTQEKKSQLEAQKRYWLHKFECPVPDLKLPLDFPREAVQGGKGNSIRFAFHDELTRQLKELARRQGTTSFMLLLSLLYVWLYKVSGEADVVIGTPVAGRTRSEDEHIAGLFLNYLPLRKQIASGQTVADLLAEVTRDTIEAFDHQEYPYDDLVESLQLPRTEGRNPLYDMIFIFQNVNIPDFTLPDTVVTPFPYVHRSSKLDLNLEGTERDGQFCFIFEYHAGLFREERIRTFVAQFTAIAERVAANGTGLTVQTIAASDPQAARRAITDFNDTLEDD